MLALALIVGGPYWGCEFFAIGIVVVLHGYFPRLFASRTAKIIVVVLLLVVTLGVVSLSPFGHKYWGRNKEIASSPAPAVPNPQPAQNPDSHQQPPISAPRQPAVVPAKPRTPKVVVEPPQSVPTPTQPAPPAPTIPPGVGGGAVGGGLNPGPCSNVQVGGVGNTQIGGICGPPPPEIVGLHKEMLAPIPRWTPTPDNPTKSEAERHEWINRLGDERYSRELDWTTANPGMRVSFSVSQPFSDPEFHVVCAHCVVTGTVYVRRMRDGYSTTPNRPDTLTRDTGVIVYVRSTSPDASIDDVKIEIDTPKPQ
jgi:hypothetical protein